jgi:hypothetical protein
MLTKKNNSAPFTYKHKNEPVLTLEDQENDAIDIEFKVLQENALKGIQEDPVEES